MDIETPFPRLTWTEAMERYGSDKPDTRFGIELVLLNDLVQNCDFAVFTGALEMAVMFGVSAYRVVQLSIPERRLTS